MFKLDKKTMTNATMAGKARNTVAAILLAILMAVSTPVAAIPEQALVPGGVAIIGLDGYSPETRICLLYTSPSPRDRQKSRMPSSA
jgi:hypothetical protein